MQEIIKGNNNRITTGNSVGKILSLTVAGLTGNFPLK